MAGFEEILRNIQVEAREVVFYKKKRAVKLFIWKSVKKPVVHLSVFDYTVNKNTFRTDSRRLIYKQKPSTNKRKLGNWFFEIVKKGSDV